MTMTEDKENKIKLLGKAICIYSRENIDEYFENDNDAIESFLRWADDLEKDSQQAERG